MARNRKPKPLPEPVVAVIDNLSHDGRGIAHINGKIVFVSGGLPGETVRLQIHRQRGSFDEAAAIEIIQPASWRQTPACPHFSVCGGCSLQHIDNAYQLHYKQQAFQQLLQRQAKIEPREWVPPLTSPAWGYRRKARLGVKFVGKKNRVIIGFRERQGRLIADSRQCEVLVPAVGHRIEALREMLYQLSIRDKIPQIEIACADNACALVIRHLAPFTADDLTQLKKFAEDHELRIYLQPGGVDSVHCFYPAAAHALHYLLPRYQLQLEFQPLQFIQINAEVNKLMIDRALEWLNCQPNDRILDLFCGIGNFSLPMARLGARVTGVEGDFGAVKQALHNAQLNDLSNCEFYRADLFQSPILDDWSKQQFDKILLDPPRSGALNIVESIQQWQPKQIVYVSCDLATLARDAQVLSQRGYSLRKAGIMDMFPHTEHVEAIALFEAI